ncbi:restriction endonuclease subunit S [Flavobacteriaceae bacterium]|nr:restriction endonuclease subunit S [Flavobacteriaceae bacterium]
MENLPKNWVETDLGNILKLKNGYAFKSKDYREEGTPLIRISNIQQGDVITEKSIYVDFNDSAEDFIVEKGDVLVAMSGATTGKYGIFNEDIKAYQNQRVGNLKPLAPNLTSRRFIYYLLGGLQNEIEDKAYGGAQPNISAKLIETIKIGLPPLPEQQRIVAKLDTLFGHLDSLKQRLEHIPTLLKQFRQSVLAQAVTGKLTEEWREGKELGDIDKVLLSLKEDRVGIGDLPKKLRPIDKSQYKLTYPQGWRLACLGEVYEIVRGASPRPKGDPKYFSDEKTDFHWIKIADFAKHSVNNSLFDTEEFLTYEGSLKSRKVDSKDLLVAASGVGSVGKSSKLRIEGYIYDGLMAIKDIDIEQSKDFISYFLKLKEEELHHSSTGTSWLNINTEILNNYIIPICTLKEQTEIVHRVEALFAKADSIEAAYENLKQQIDSLPQAILAKAFKGELVEQLPTDGDAKDLLKEIAALRASLEKEKKSKNKKKVNA